MATPLQVVPTPDVPPAPATNRKRFALGLIVAMGLVSLFVRAPIMNRGLSFHHEFMTAHMLVTLQRWNEYGVRNAYFAPITSFGNAGDKGIPLSHGGNDLVDAAGQRYYVSLPPLGYLAPYAVFQALGITPDVLPLQLWNVFLQFATVLLLVLLFRSLYGETEAWIDAAVLGSAVMIFSACTLWFFSNVYFTGMLSVPLWLGALYYWLRLREKGEARDGSDRVDATAFFALHALCCFTDWIGFLFPLVAGLRLRSRKHWALLLAPPALALTVMLAQYGQITGYGPLLELLWAKFWIRTGFGSGEQVGDIIMHQGHHPFMKESWDILLIYVQKLYGPFLLLLAFFTTIALSWREWRAQGLFSAAEKTVLLLAATSLVRDVVFFDATVGHDCSLLWDAVPLSLLTGMMFSKVWPRLKSGKLGARTAVVATLLCIGFSVAGFVGENSIEPQRTEFYRMAGGYIAANTAPDEAIALAGATMLPAQLVFYAKRNILMYRDENHFRDHLKRNGVARGVVFHMAPDGNLAKVERLTVR